MSKNKRENEACVNADSCGLLEAERELSIESLKAHLSEQRHDFFNLLQVLYGYTQLKKYDKVLKNINDYCRQMENLGRLYNGKCIKLADLLYTKRKEADSLDLNLEVIAEVSFEPEVRLLDAGNVLHVVDRVLSAFYYMLDSEGCKEATMICSLKENKAAFLMEIYCRNIREGKLAPEGFEFPDKEMYWKKLEIDISDFPMIIGYCRDTGLEGKLLEEGATFELSISKGSRPDRY
ncbi:MAG TPA: Spo0B domain-containing protein [Clostridia bacterium]|nr:Spo0B domain-containing protein [Clostridia bacterium]